jgi:2-deoxy-D-gluconate 3-dehydrogenase
MAMSDLSKFSLAGKSILVTGANTGIGQAISLAIGRAGGGVVGVGRSDMSETAAAMLDLAAPFQAMDCNLADHKAAQAMLEEAWTVSGPLDALVNNAGIIRRRDALDFTEADWDAVMDLDLKSLFFLCQAFARRAIADKRQGRIVNIASVLSFQGGIRVASYTAAKHGVLGITRLLACEWAGRGINVNAIAPGYVETNNTAALRADTERSATILDRIPAGRWGKPEDIGDAAVFLLAPASAYVHGAVIAVDGGWLAR